MASGSFGTALQEIDRVFNQGSVSGMSEAGLLRRFVDRGDDLAFEALVACHGPMVLGTCRRMLRDPNDVDDAFQATFLVLVRRAGHFRETDRIGPWLHAVAVRVAARTRADAARRGRREAGGSTVDPVAPETLEVSDELRRVLDEEIARLPEKYQRPVVLCYLEGLSHEAAARMLRWTTGSLRGRLDRARAKLRDRLTRRGMAPTALSIGAALSPETTTAAVPPVLVSAALAVAKGAGSPTSARAVGLADGVLRGMLVAKALTWGTALAGGLAVLATGMATLVARPSSTTQAKDQATPPPALAGAPEAPPPPKAVVKAAVEGDTVTLHISDLKNNAPLPGVELKVRIGGKETSTATSDSQGRFAFKLPSPLPKMLSVRASKDGYAPIILSVIHPAFEDPFPVSYNLAMVPVAPVSGVVRDEEGKPVFGVEVTPTFWTSSLNARNRERFDVEDPVKTDDQGRWHSDILPSAIGLGRISSISFRFMHTGFQMVENSGKTPAEAVGRGGVVVLPKGLSIPGRVVDQNGKPIRGASITLRHPDRFGDNVLPQATSDAGGLFQLKSVPPGELLMTTRVDGYAPDLRRVKVEKGIPSSEIRLNLGRTVHGLVRDDDGKPIGRVTVYLYGWHGERASAFRMESGDDGRFVWEHAPEETIWLEVMAEGYLPARTQEVGPKDNEKTFTLHRIPKIRGTVVDVETGRPIESFTLIPGTERGNGFPTYWNRDQERAQVSGHYEIQFTESASVGRRLRVEAEGYRPEVSRRFLDREERVEINFTMRKESGVSGLVQLPGGSPLAGAEILQITTSQPAFLTNGHWPANNDHRVAKSGPDGRFTFPAQEPPYTLVALHDRGFAELRVETPGSTTPPMTVEPWGRVEGILRIGSKPGATQTVNLSYNRQGDTSKAIPYFSGTATTDASGHFVFERALPGKATVTRSIPLGRMTYGNSNSTPVQIRPSETTQVTLGGVGRPVVGRVVPPAGRNQPVDWTFGLGSIMSKPSLSQRLGLLARRSYTAKIEPDGTFRADDVEPGSYTLILNIEAPPSNPNGIGFGNNNIGSAKREFDIPALPGGRSDDPLDLGTIELVPSRPQKVIKVSEVAPAFQVETLDGKPLSLADYRGRFVLLDFWATWCGPCKEQTPHLKAAFEAFGKDARFAMVGLSLDESREKPRKYVETNALGWTQGFLGSWAESKVTEDFGVSGIPSIWLIGPDGRVIAKDLHGTGIKEAVAEALSSISPKK